MLVKLVVAVRHRGCPTEAMAGEVSLTVIAGDAGGDLLVLQAPDALVDAHLQAWATASPTPVEVVARTEGAAVFRTHPPPRGVVQAIRAARCTVLWPAVFREHRETYAVLAPSREAARELLESLRSLGDVEVESCGDVDPCSLDARLSVADLASGMTPRQLACLRLAVGAGYYEVPRGAAAADLATRMGVGRTTYEEHLRKAERLLLRRFAQVLAAHPVLARSARRGRGRPRAPLR